MRKGHKGFTLVELLVVIAIIALLISILAPSLKAAKDLAKNAICKTHLHGIGTAIALYTNANRDMLPPYNNKYADKGLDHVTILQVYKMAGAVPIQDAGHPMLYGPLSYLLAGDALTPDMIYCPSQSSSQWMRSSYPGTYGVTPVNPNIVWSNVRYSCGYSFNLSLKTSPSDATIGMWEFTRTSEFPTNIPMASDVLFRYWDLAHGASIDNIPPESGPAPSYNLGYADTHVTSRSSLAAYQYQWEFGDSLFGSLPEWMTIRDALLSLK